MQKDPMTHIGPESYRTIGDISLFPVQLRHCLPQLGEGNVQRYVDKARFFLSITRTSEKIRISKIFRL